MAAGEELGLVAVLADQGDGLLGRAGTHVVERSGDHDGSPSVVSDGPAVVVRAVTPG